MHLVDTDLFTQLIKLAKESGEQIDHLLWLRILGELSEAYHVGVKERDIVKRVDDSLVILDAGEDMERDELAEQILRLFDLHLDDPLLVVLASYLHLTAMRRQNQQSEEYELEHAVDHICLQVQHLELDEEEVL